MSEYANKTYEAYGLAIRSRIPLTEFALNGAGPAQVIVTFGEDPGWIAEVRGDYNYIRIRPGEARFWFKDVGGFIVKDGSQIIVVPEPDGDRACLRLYIEGMMMAIVLHQRGMCVLHASVVDVGGSAVAFVGAVGAGKSSLAAALYSRGHRVVTDDNAAIEFSSGVPVVLPGYPSVKLFPEIAASLGFQNGSLHTLHAAAQKVAGIVTTRFARAPLPLKAIYVLSRDCDAAMTRLPSLATTVELIRNSVPTRWGHRGDARQLLQVGCIAKQVPAFVLRTFSDLALLSALAESVERHALEIGACDAEPCSSLGVSVG